MRASDARAVHGLSWRAKRWLYIVHRWLGIGACLFFAMWFASGLVMLHVPFPALAKAERLTGLAPIDFEKVRFPPGPHLRAAGDTRPPRALVLQMRGSSPVWRVQDGDGAETLVSAETGMVAATPDAAVARRVAEAFGKAPVTDVARVMRDQWTVAGGYDRHRPLWKATLAGADGRVLYVSGTSGLVVLDTDRRERFWNWLGAVPHWLYPTVLRQTQPAWRQVVMWISGPAIIVAVTGMWIGILRLRAGRRRFSRGRMTPYRGWMKWHHVTGLIGGVALLLWIFSGWLSVDPWRLFASEGITADAVARYEGRFDPPTDPAHLAGVLRGARLVEWRAAAGRPVVLVDRPAGRTVLDAATLRPIRFTEGQIVAAAAGLVPGYAIRAVDRLTAPDAYWYAVNGVAVLPVLRIRFDDPARSWVHIDPASGMVLGTLDARRRVYRWAFDLFHRWDLTPLIATPPARQLLIWLFSLIGLASSVTGVWIGVRRLRR